MKPEDALHIVEDGEAEDLNVFIRGNVNAKGAGGAARRFLTVLCERTGGRSQGAAAGGSWRRRSPARNPLTARVMVNRVWGRTSRPAAGGARRATSAAGAAADAPGAAGRPGGAVHENGWSMKLLCARWCSRRRTASPSRRGDEAPRTHRAAAASIPTTLLWRMNRRRLTIEQWRDAMLSASGRLVEAAAASRSSWTTRSETADGLRASAGSS